MREEKWKNINEYNGLYQVSNMGNVRSLFNGNTNLLIPHPDTDGYLQIKLSLNGVISQKSVHKLVAIAFIPNLEEKSIVVHINGKRKENNAENLRWVTRQEMYNPITSEKMKEAKAYKIIGRRESDGHIEVFNSIQEVCVNFGATEYQINKILKENERLLKVETTFLEMIEMDLDKIINPDIPIKDSYGDKWILVHCNASYDKDWNPIWIKPQPSRRKKTETIEKKNNECKLIDINEMTKALLPKEAVEILPTPYELKEDK